MSDRDDGADGNGDRDGGDDPFEGLDDPHAGPDEDRPSPEDLFTEVDVEAVDEDAVWERLVEADEDGTEPVGPAEHETVVPKRSYCERCEYFSSPPDVACTHPDTEILELVDVRHFRVVNCPVVARRRGLDEGTGPADAGDDQTDPG